MLKCSWEIRSRAALDIETHACMSSIPVYRYKHTDTIINISPLSSTLKL